MKKSPISRVWRHKKRSIQIIKQNVSKNCNNPGKYKLQSNYGAEWKQQIQFVGNR